MRTRQISGLRRKGDAFRSRASILISLTATAVAITTFWDSANAKDELQASLNTSHSSFSTKSHPKADGVHLTLSFPKTWKAKEGKHPHIVQTFAAPGTDQMPVLCILALGSLPAGYETETDPARLRPLFQPDQVRDLIPPDATLIYAKSTAYDGQPGTWMELTRKGQRAGMEAYSASLLQAFGYRGKLVGLDCGVTAGGPMGVGSAVKAAVDKKFKASIPLFAQIANTIVLEDKWK